MFRRDAKHWHREKSHVNEPCVRPMLSPIEQVVEKFEKTPTPEATIIFKAIKSLELASMYTSVALERIILLHKAEPRAESAYLSSVFNDRKFEPFIFLARSISVEVDEILQGIYQSHEEAEVSDVDLKTEMARLSMTPEEREEDCRKKQQ